MKKYYSNARGNTLIKYLAFFLTVSILTACSDWVKLNSYYGNAAWSDKGDLYAQWETESFNRVNRLIPFPGENKEEDYIVIRNRSLDEIYRIKLQGEPILNLSYFSEYGGYLVLDNEDQLPFLEDALLKSNIINLSGQKLFESELGVQLNCFNLEKDIYKTYFPAFVPSPNGQLILKAYQNEDCSVEIEFLDAESGFITANNISAPVIYDAQVAWTEEGNVMVQGWSDEGGAISWLVKTDGNITEFNNKAFDDECFVPATASYYVSQSLDVVAPYTFRELEVISFDDIKDGIEKNENGYFYSLAFLDDPLNVFGCQSIQLFL